MWKMSPKFPQRKNILRWAWTELILSSCDSVFSFHQCLRCKKGSKATLLPPLRLNTAWICSDCWRGARLWQRRSTRQVRQRRAGRRGRLRRRWPVLRVSTDSAACRCRRRRCRWKWSRCGVEATTSELRLTTWTKTTTTKHFASRRPRLRRRRTPNRRRSSDIASLRSASTPPCSLYVSTRWTLSILKLFSRSSTLRYFKNLLALCDTCWIYCVLYFVLYWAWERRLL